MKPNKSKPKQSDPLKELFQFLRKNKIRWVFWTCPKGCQGRVVWNKEKTDATCQECGCKKSDPQPKQSAIANVLWQYVDELRKQADVLEFPAVWTVEREREAKVVRIHADAMEAVLVKCYGERGK